MKHFTDKLLNEEYENAAWMFTEEQRAEAKKAFEDHVKEGWLDLENFHRAYDEVLEPEDLLSVFEDNGSIKKSAYGLIKDAETPNKKLLKQLWTYTYSTQEKTIEKNGRTITLSPKALKSKEQFFLEKKRAEFKTYMDKVQTSIQDILNNKLSDLVKAHQDVAVKIYGDDPDTVTKISRDFSLNVSVDPYESKFGCFDIAVSTYKADLNHDGARRHVLQTTIRVEKDVDDIRDVLKTIYTNVKANLTDLVKEENETLSRISIIKEICKKYNYQLDKHEKMYLRVKSTGQLVYINLEKEPVILEYDTEVPVVVKGIDDVEPVAIKKHHEWTSRSYVDSNTYNSWNSKALSKREMDELKLFTNEEEGKANAACCFGSDYWLADGNDKEYYYKLPGFDTWSRDRYECDSSD